MNVNVKSNSHKEDIFLRSQWETSGDSGGLEGNPVNVDLLPTSILHVLIMHYLP